MLGAIIRNERQYGWPVHALQLAERAATLQQAAEPLLGRLLARLTSRRVVLRAPQREQRSNRLIRCQCEVGYREQLAQRRRRVRRSGVGRNGRWFHGGARSRDDDLGWRGFGHWRAGAR